MKQIEAIIFDWAGTMVDYGCMAPLYAMQAAFAQYQLQPNIDDLKRPMGRSKLEHIQTVLAMPSYTQDFSKQHGRNYNEADVADIYEQFEQKLFPLLDQCSELIPGVLAVQSYLRSQNIKIGTTTGYTKAMMKVVSSKAKQQGYEPDAIFTPDDVSRARPYPYMIQRNLSALDIKDVSGVLKVGDTIVDIEEGLHAGCCSVGVILGSSLLCLREDEVSQLSKQQLLQQMCRVKYQMFAAGAHYVIDTIDELPQLINHIQHIH